MKKFIKLTVVCVFLFAFSVLSVNAQNCSDPNCPFNNKQMTGPKDMLYIGGGGYYTLPEVYGASYNWYTNGGILQKTAGGYCNAEYRVRSASGPFTYCYYDFAKGEMVCDGTYQYFLWDPQSTTETIECVVTYNGHTHYFYKKIFIWEFWKPGLDLE